MTCKAIGVDLGTTYSCVGVFKNGRVEIIANNDGNRMTPSCVSFTEDETLVGEAARNRLPIDPTNTVYGVKRMIGRRFADSCVQNDMKHWPFKVVSGSSGEALVEVWDKGETKRYAPEYISSLVLANLKATAEYFLGHSVTDAVITVPANHGDAQRQATVDAAQLAGLNVLRIVNEPTAAALAYGFENISAAARIVLVFDLGGGTLDVSVLSIDKNNQFEVKATAGDAHLGGDDFDNRMVTHFSAEFKRKYQQDLSTDKRAVRRLYAVCERTKRTLSQGVIGSVEIDNLFDGRDFMTKIKREQFEKMCADLFQNTIPPVEKALTDAKLSKGAVAEIVLVGGSSRIPKIQQLLQDYFAGQRVNKTINPDEAIAHGAAILAAKLSGTAVPNIQRIELSDITGLSLGLSDYFGKFNVFIPRGSRIPITVKQASWETSQDYQHTSTILIYEGEYDMVINNNLLGQFLISGYPVLPAGQVKFTNVMEIDANGILHVSSTEQSTGKMNHITCSFTRGVTV